MKRTISNPASDDLAVIAAPRPAQVNEVTQRPVLFGTDMPVSRPHILDRRNARWARRATY